MATEKVKIKKTWNGLRVYPVTYKGKQYGVDIIQKYGIQRYGCARYSIFEYNEKCRLFIGHRKNNICSDAIPNTLHIMPDYVIESDSLRITELRRFLPHILINIFDFYENKKKRTERIKKEIEEAKNKDGIVK